MYRFVSSNNPSALKKAYLKKYNMPLLQGKLDKLLTAYPEIKAVLPEDLSAKKLLVSNFKYLTKVYCAFTNYLAGKSNEDRKTILESFVVGGFNYDSHKAKIGDFLKNSANGFEIQKRAQVLGTLTRQMKGLCVAGTHGKTTTSTMCAHIMHQSSLDCNAFLGGISKNYGTNYILSDSDYVVIEADEFDRSFHWLRPWMSVITSTDPDHLDIYGTKEAYLESFRHYTTLIQPGGALIIHRDLEMKENLQEGVRRYDYALTEGDFHAENIRIENGGITFDFVSPIESVKDIVLGQPIPINIENGIAAMAMAQLCGCTAEELRYGMRTYGGVDRRFDFKIKTSQLVFLSDYAHHPKEIYQSARSIRELYKDRRITAIFQPHLYTRTRDFYREFAEALSQLDEVVLTEIYPAREQPIEGVTSQLIYDNLKPGVDKHIINKADVLDYVRSHDFDVLIVLGAGDLDNMVPQITKLLQQK